MSSSQRVQRAPKEKIQDTCHSFGMLGLLSWSRAKLLRWPIVALRKHFKKYPSFHRWLNLFRVVSVLVKYLLPFYQTSCPLMISSMIMTIALVPMRNIAMPIMTLILATITSIMISSI